MRERRCKKWAYGSASMIDEEETEKGEPTAKDDDPVLA